MKKISRATLLLLLATACTNSKTDSSATQIAPCDPVFFGEYAALGIQVSAAKKANEVQKVKADFDAFEKKYASITSCTLTLNDANGTPQGPKTLNVKAGLADFRKQLDAAQSSK